MGSAAVVVGWPRRLDGSADPSDAARRSAARARSNSACRFPSFCRTNGCRATRLRRASPSASGTGGGAKRSSTRPRRPSSCRTTSITGDRDAIALVAGPRPRRHRSGGRRSAALLRLSLDVHEPYKGYAELRSLRRDPAGAGPARRSAQRLVDAGVVRDVVTFRAAVWLSGHARELKAGEYRFDRPMTRARSRGQDRARRRLSPADHVSRGADDRRDGAGVRRRRARHGRRLRTAGARRLASSEPRPRARGISKGYLFPETYTLRRDTAASALVDADGRAVRSRR